MNATAATPEQTARHVEQTQAFHAHAAVFALSMTAIFAVNLLTNLAAGTASDWPAWWSAYALIGWSLGLGIHGFVVWLATPGAPAAPSHQRSHDVREEAS